MFWSVKRWKAKSSLCEYIWLSTCNSTDIVFIYFFTFCIKFLGKQEPKKYDELRHFNPLNPMQYNDKHIYFFIFDVDV